jgi:3-hydroxymyristoyl/3-hydroxydecanoyl-(acyl carrier protein) dehydratase
MSKNTHEWLPLSEVSLTPQGRLESVARLEAASEWFRGHFEGTPVMPGVTMLALVVETVRKHGIRAGRKLEADGFAKVRFKRFVFPGEDLLISVKAMTTDPQAELDFYVSSRNGKVVQGVMRVTENLS